MKDLSHIEELLPSYVLGALEGDELAEVERALDEGPPELRAKLFEWTRQLEAMSEGVPAREPSETARARILAAIADAADTAAAADAAETGAGATADPASGRLLWLPWAASVTLLLLSSWLAVQHRSLSREMADLFEERADLANEVASLRQDLGRAEALAARLARSQRILGAPNARQVLLASTESGARASANAYLDPSTGSAVFYASDLPALTDDRTYQLWFIGGEGPVSAGVFDVDEDGSATLLTSGTAPAEETLVWAVTVEPAGGVPSPTGPIVLKS